MSCYGQSSRAQRRQGEQVQVLQDWGMNQRQAEDECWKKQGVLVCFACLNFIKRLRMNLFLVGEVSLVEEIAGGLTYRERERVTKDEAKI